MKPIDGLLIIITIVVTAILVSISLLFEWSSIASYLISVIPVVIMIIKMIQQRRELKEERQKTLVAKLKPVKISLSGILEKQNVSIEIKDYFIRKLESFLKEKNVTETVVLSCFEFANILEIPKEHNMGYALAIAYTLSNKFALEEGDSEKEIDNSVRKRGTISYGSKYDLEQFDVDWYKRFCDSDNILEKSYADLFKEVEHLDIKEIDKKQVMVENNYSETKSFIENPNSKIDKLIELLIRTIPEVDFNKILSTLRTEVVTISTRGSKDPESYSDKKGSEYLSQALDERMSLDTPKLNRAVRFILLDQLVGRKGTRNFDLKKWGKEIEDRARHLRHEDGGDRREFSFVILKSSINELYFFGDKLPEKGAIKMTPEILDGLKPEETTKSTLQIIAKALADNEISLTDFIDHNLEYLDGIPSDGTAEKITEAMCKQVGVEKWRISDFPRKNIQIDDLTKIGIPETQAQLILSESKSLSKMLKLY